MVEALRDAPRNKARRYSNLKYALAILDTLYLFVLLLVFAGSGISKNLAGTLTGLGLNTYLTLGLYLLIVFLAYYLLNLPLTLYSSYILEHRFQLSRQKIGDWFCDQIKGGLIYYGLSLVLIAAFYYVLRHYGHNWWWVVSLLWIFFSMILARLLPIAILPLFFKYKKLSDERLRERIMELAKRMQVRILDVFEIDLSKKTLKANAVFVGMGKTRRVLLADTLRDKYSDDEIKVILAHEFAHYKLRHLFKLILVNAQAALLAFYLIYRTSGYALRWFGLSSLLDIAALPVIFLYLVLFGIITQPITNYITRNLERDADRLALKVTGLKAAFISTMDKLSNQNLSDRNPRPLIKFFFFDHPPIDERIATANK